MEFNPFYPKFVEIYSTFSGRREPETTQLQ